MGERKKEMREREEGGGRERERERGAFKESEIGTERLRVGGGKRRVARCHAVQLLL